MYIVQCTCTYYVVFKYINYVVKSINLINVNNVIINKQTINSHTI